MSTITLRCFCRKCTFRADIHCEQAPLALSQALMLAEQHGSAVGVGIYARNVVHVSQTSPATIHADAAERGARVVQGLGATEEVAVLLTFSPLERWFIEDNSDSKPLVTEWMRQLLEEAQGYAAREAKIALAIWESAWVEVLNK